jgi:hypothetical protein
LKWRCRRTPVKSFAPEPAVAWRSKAALQLPSARPDRKASPTLTGLFQGGFVTRNAIIVRDQRFA